MRLFFQPTSAPGSLGSLLKYNVGACVAIFLLLELWRPCFFLTDDNLSGTFPVLTEVGRHLKNGESPFVSDYLFGGHYNWLRDAGASLWHPFYLLPSLLCDTPARFWLVDLVAFCDLILTCVGFTLLAHSLREEYNSKLPDRYLVFYTISFVFSTYVLTVGASWVNLLGNQSALPWLALGILEKKFFRGVALIALFTIHQFLGGYPAATVSNGLCITLFAFGVSVGSRSPKPFFMWYGGNLVALLGLTPILLQALDGFVHSQRQGILPVEFASLYSIPAVMFPYALFLGNWSELIARWSGQPFLFPYLSTLLACPAAWCLVPAFFPSPRWRYLEALCFGLSVLLVIMIIRPNGIAIVMQHIPFLRSMRWPFRESLQLLFFLHLFLILRPQERFARQRPAIALASLAAFLLPLPFIHVPSFNALSLDRQVLFSGKGDTFWAAVKTQLKPSDEIATVIDWPYWQKNAVDIPYTLLGTANFPAYYKIPCISGYSPTAPSDQLPLKAFPWYWFGAFKMEQVKQIMAERPDLKLIRIESTHPLKITLTSPDGTVTDLSPYLHP